MSEYSPRELVDALQDLIDEARELSFSIQTDMERLGVQWAVRQLQFVRLSLANRHGVRIGDANDAVVVAVTEHVSTGDVVSITEVTDQQINETRARLALSVLADDPVVKHKVIALPPGRLGDERGDEDDGTGRPVTVG